MRKIIKSAVVTGLLFGVVTQAFAEIPTVNTINSTTDTNRPAVLTDWYKSNSNPYSITLNVDGTKILATNVFGADRYTPTIALTEEFSSVTAKISEGVCGTTLPNLTIIDFKVNTQYCGYFEAGSYLLTVQATSGGSNTAPFNNISTNVTVINDPTTFSPLAPLTTNDKASPVTPFAGVTLTDADSTAFTATISLDNNAKGTLSATTIASGTLSEVQTAIQAITFTPAQNRVAVDATETTTITLKVTADGVDGTTTNTVVTTSMNDAPTFTTTQNDVDVNVSNEFTYTARGSDEDKDPLIFSATNTLPDWLTYTSNPVEIVFAGTGVSPTSNSGTYDSPDGTDATAANILIASTGLHAVDGKVFFADAEEYGVRYIDENAKIQTFYAGDGQYTTLNVNDVAYDPNTNTVYMTDYSSHKIVKSVSGGALEDVATGLNYFVQSLLLKDNKLYVGARDAIYEIDLSNSNAVKRIAGTGTGSQNGYSNTGTATTSQIGYVAGMAFDSNGDLIFVDRFNKIIRKINLAKDTVETIAGTQGTASVAGNGGAARDATFEDPSGIAIDLNGRIYITERLDKTVRVIETNGTIEEFATVTSSGFLDSVTLAETGELYIGGSNKISQVDTNAKVIGTPTCLDIGTHDVNLTVSDGDLNATQNFTLTVKNDGSCNSAPADLALSKLSIAENSALGTSIGTISTTDADLGDTHSYSLSCSNAGGDDASFTIDTSTLKTNAVFDYEVKNSYEICIRTTDSANANYDKNITIAISDVNEAPPSNSGGTPPPAPEPEPEPEPEVVEPEPETPVIDPTPTLEVEHQLGDVVASSELEETQTQTDSQTGDIKTSTTTTNDTNEAVSIEVVAKAQGDVKASHSLAVGDRTTKAESELPNTSTTIKADKSVETKATLPSNGAEIKVVAKSDGTASHAVKLGEKESKANSLIRGAQTKISAAGNVNTSVVPQNYADQNGCSIRAVVDTDTKGETISSFVKVCNGTAQNQDTVNRATPFEAGNEATIYEDAADNNRLKLTIETPVSKPLQF